MTTCQFDQHGIITDVFGRFAIALGFNVNGRVLIRAESLCLKLKTSWTNRTASTGVFDKNDSAASTPNLALILTVGDKVTFDAMTLQKPAQNIRWVASAGSLKVEKVCTDAKTFRGYGNIVELDTKRGVLSFADKRILFDCSASFPKAVQDLRSMYRLGDMAFFVAVEQSDTNTRCHWRGTSVERYSVSAPVISQRVVVKSEPTPQQATFFPPPQAFSPTPLPEPMSISPPEVRQPSPRSKSPSPQRRHRSRSPLTRARNPPDGFDLRMYNSLPQRLVGYGRVTYYGATSSLLKDIDTHRLVFFFNRLVTYSCRGKTRSERPFGVDRVVYFEAVRSTQRVNLRAFYDARRVELLDEQEEAKMQSKWRNEGKQTPVAENRAMPFLDKSIHDRIDRSNANHRSVPSEFTRRIGSRFSKEPSTTRTRPLTASPPNPEVEKQVNSSTNPFAGWVPKTKPTPEECDQSDQSERRVVEDHKIDARPFNLEEIDKVRFDRKPTDFGELGRRSNDDTSNIEVTVGNGDTRKCVLRTSAAEEIPEDEFEEFMNTEEDFAQKYEFADDDDV